MQSERSTLGFSFLSIYKSFEGKSVTTPVDPQETWPSIREWRQKVIWRKLWDIYLWLLQGRLWPLEILFLLLYQLLPPPTPSLRTVRAGIEERKEKKKECGQQAENQSDQSSSSNSEESSSESLYSTAMRRDRMVATSLPTTSRFSCSRCSSTFRS